MFVYGLKCDKLSAVEEELLMTKRIYHVIKLAHFSLRFWAAPLQDHPFRKSLLQSIAWLYLFSQIPILECFTL